MGKIKDNWQIVVFTMFITILGNMLFSSFIRHDDNVRNAASIEYVDKQDTELRAVDLKLELELETKADNITVIEIKEELAKKADSEIVNMIYVGQQRIEEKLDKLIMKDE